LLNASTDNAVTHLVH